MPNPLPESERRRLIEKALAMGVPPNRIKQDLAKLEGYAAPSSDAVRMGLEMGEVLTGEPSPMKGFGEPPSALPRPSAEAEAVEAALGPTKRQMSNELLAGGAKMLGAYAGGAYGGRLLPSVPALASIGGQVTSTALLEAARQRLSGEPLQPGRIATEAGIVGGLGGAEAGVGRLMAKSGGVSPKAIDYAYTAPGRAFKSPTTAERLTLVEELQQSLDDALRHPSQGKQRLNSIIRLADERVGLAPSRLGGRETPAGMVDGRVLVDSMRGVVKGGGDAATQAAEKTIAGEAEAMLERVAAKASAHPQNRPNAYGEGGVYRGGGGSVVSDVTPGRPQETRVMIPKPPKRDLGPEFTEKPGPLEVEITPGTDPTVKTSFVKGQPRTVADRPLWITHQEYDDLLREHLTKPSTRVQQAAAPTVTTQEMTADTLRDKARAAATDFGYRALNREGVTYPSESGPITAREAGKQAQNYLNLIERLKSYFPKGKPSRPATGGVLKTEEAGEAMMRDDPGELGYRIEQALKEYQAATGDPLYDRFREIALRGEWAKKEAQPYLANMARVFIRPGGVSVVERVPFGSASGRFLIRRSMRPGIRSPLASATGALSEESP